MDNSKITALNVSNYFTNKAINKGDTLTVMQALKLTYIAQGFHLALEEKPFFAEKIYAWRYGPSIQEVYDHLKKVSTDNPIETKQNDVSSFNKKQEEILRVVFNKYVKFDAWSLSQLTHRPGTPWHQSYKEEEENSLISQHIIKKYFKENIVTPESFILLLCEV